MKNQLAISATCFSATTMGFYPQAWIDDGTYKETLPDDIITLTDSELAYRDELPPEGKILGSKKGRPIWINIPPLTHAEQVDHAEQNRDKLLTDASGVMSDLKAALILGIISDEDKELLAKWLAYIKAVRGIDTSAAPNIEWPTKPE